MEMRARRQAEHKKIFGQQTPRRWGWGTPLKKRTATRMLNVTTWKHFVNKLVVFSIFRGKKRISRLYPPGFSPKVSG